jgi:hypothetical protein
MVAWLGLQPMFCLLCPCGEWCSRSGLVAWLALTHVVLVFFSRAMLLPFGLGALMGLEWDLKCNLPSFHIPQLHEPKIP